MTAHLQVKKSISTILVSSNWGFFQHSAIWKHFRTSLACPLPSYHEQSQLFTSYLRSLNHHKNSKFPTEVCLLNGNWLDCLVQTVTRQGMALTRRFSNCGGWNCLTAPEHFGIIFSIVVVSVVLLLAYTYYLGRRSISHRDRSSVRLPGGRRAQPRRDLPPNIVLGELPITQQWPGYPARVIYQPVVYNVTPNQAPYAQPYIMGGTSFQGMQPSHMVGWSISEPHQPGVPSLFHQPPSQIPPNIRQEPVRNVEPVGELTPRQPSWRQRLSRLFRMPVGRASTIASSSAPNTPTLNARLSSSYTRPIESVGENEGRARTASSTNRHGKGSQNSPQADETESLRTDAATVHSDDFRAPPPSGNEFGLPRGSSEKPHMKHESGQYQANAFAEDYSARSQSVPSQSSLEESQERETSPQPSDSSSKAHDGLRIRQNQCGRSDAAPEWQASVAAAPPL